jgi:hypothetical protein
MRKALFVVCMTVCMFGMPLAAVAGFFNAQGQLIGRVDPRVTSLLVQFPGGGPGLRAAISLLLKADPKLADDVVFSARTANPAQRQAIRKGIADSMPLYVFRSAF